MELIRCCGVRCGECRFSRMHAQAARRLRAKYFSCNIPGEAICGIYQCCVVEKGPRHCGLCPDMPCALFDAGDPTLSPSENREIHRKQVETLRNMAGMEKGGF